MLEFARVIGSSARLVCFCALTWLPVSLAIAAEPLKFAFFEVDASPPIGSPNAYEPVVEVLIPLSCRGVVLLGTDKPIVLCAVDWIGIGNDSQKVFRQEYRSRIMGWSGGYTSIFAVQQEEDWSKDRPKVAAGGMM